MRMKPSILIPAATLFAAALLPLQAFAKEKADLLFTNGKVLTVDAEFSVASSVAVKEGRIVAVGGPEVAANIDAARTVDLKGRILMPGFIDTHIHVMGQARRAIDLSGIKSIAEVQALVRAKAAELGAGEWITGSGWDEALLSEQRNITRQDLDLVSPGNPVLLTRAGGHSAVANSLALKLAGIERDTPDPDDGLIERDEAGEPNGIIRERYDLVGQFVPRPTAEEVRPSLIAALRKLPPLGITSIMEALSTIDDEPVELGGLDQPARWNTYAQFRAIYKDIGPDLPRATLYISYPGAERLKRFPYHTGHGDDRLKLGPIGEMPAVDGGFTGPTALTIDDYKGIPGFKGKASTPPDELLEMVRTSRSLGWQMATHAIGDAAIRDLVNVYAKVLSEQPKKDHRWFASHFTMLPPQATLDLMRKHDIWAAAQPNFLYNLEGRYVQTLDGERLQHINPVATPLKNGINVVMGSDNLPIGPLVGIYTAVTRRGMSDQVYGIEEAVSREQAIRLYTQRAAYLTWDEAKKGSIEKGKFADLVVLDRDLLTVPDAEIRNINVDMTVIGGRIVFDRKNASAGQ